MKKQILLKAAEHNWCLTGPGDWSVVKWRIFRDGSYAVTTSFNPMFEEYESAQDQEHRPKPTKKNTTGKMNEDSITALQEAIKNNPWKDPSLEVFACDGVTWEIESYDEDGSVDNTSGGLENIYGHNILETFIGLLPDNGELYDSSAFILVRK